MKYPASVANTVSSSLFGSLPHERSVVDFLPHDHERQGKGAADLIEIVL